MSVREFFERQHVWASKMFWTVVGSYALTCTIYGTVKLVHFCEWSMKEAPTSITRPVIEKSEELKLDSVKLKNALHENSAK